MRSWTKIRSDLAVAARTGMDDQVVARLRDELAASRLRDAIEAALPRLTVHDRVELVELLVNDREGPAAP
jgi:hypothetical protein